MVKVRFLESVYIGGQINKSFGFNDEVDLENNFAERLQAVGRVDILAEEKILEKPKKAKKIKNVEKGEE